VGLRPPSRKAARPVSFNTVVVTSPVPLFNGPDYTISRPAGKMHPILGQIGEEAGLTS